MIETGSDAPDFDLKVDSSTRVRLSDFRGRRNVLLVFHPFAFTAVCEEEALDLQENLPAFESAETDVLLVSCDSAPSRQAWKEKLGLTYTLALGLLAARRGRTGVRRLRRERGRARPRHVPDRQGRGRGLEPRQRRRHAAQRADLRPARRSRRVTLARYEWGDDQPASARLPARRHEPRPALPPARRAARRALPRRRARPARARRLDLGAAVEPRAARRRRARCGPGGTLRLARALLRRPCCLRGRGRGTGSRRAARPARSRDPASPVRRPRARQRTRGGIGRTPPSRRGSTGATRRACSRRRRASSSRPSCGSTSSPTTTAAGATGTARAPWSPPTAR